MVSFNEDLRKPEQLYKRTGAPRLNWIDDNLQRAWNTINADGEESNEFDVTNDGHRLTLIEAAENREI